MQITVNGEKAQMVQGQSVEDVLKNKDLLGKRMAVEYNGRILPRSLYEQTVLCEGDELEIVMAVGGG